MPHDLTAAQQRVAKVQTALNANGAQLDVDGKMGAKTRDALKAYQSAHHEADRSPRQREVAADS